MAPELKLLKALQGGKFVDGAQYRPNIMSKRMSENFIGVRNFPIMGIILSCRNVSKRSTMMNIPANIYSGNAVSTYL